MIEQHLEKNENLSQNPFFSRPKITRANASRAHIRARAVRARAQPEKFCASSARARAARSQELNVETLLSTHFLKKDSESFIEALVKSRNQNQLQRKGNLTRKK